MELGVYAAGAGGSPAAVPASLDADGVMGLPMEEEDLQQQEDGDGDGTQMQHGCAPKHAATSGGGGAQSQQERQQQQQLQQQDQMCAGLVNRLYVTFQTFLQQQMMPAMISVDSEMGNIANDAHESIHTAQQERDSILADIHNLRAQAQAFHDKIMQAQEADMALDQQLEGQ